MISSESLREMLRYFNKNNMVFEGESKFQVEIEKYFISQGYMVEPEYKIYIKNKKARIDFFVTCNNNSSIFEVKYKLHQTSYIKNAVYAFFKDISRIEYALENDPKINNGFCIFLSNESRFWTGNQRNDPDADAREFKLYDGYVLTGTKIWHSKNDNDNVRENYPPIRIKGKYTITWQDYGQIIIANQRDTQFKYVIVPITRS